MVVGLDRHAVDQRDVKDAPLGLAPELEAHGGRARAKGRGGGGGPRLQLALDPGGGRTQHGNRDETQSRGGVRAARGADVGAGAGLEPAQRIDRAGGRTAKRVVGNASRRKDRDRDLTVGVARPPVAAPKEQAECGIVDGTTGQSSEKYAKAADRGPRGAADDRPPARLTVGRARWPGRVVPRRRPRRRQGRWPGQDSRRDGPFARRSAPGRTDARRAHRRAGATRRAPASAGALPAHCGATSSPHAATASIIPGTMKMSRKNGSMLLITNAQQPKTM